MSDNLRQLYSNIVAALEQLLDRYSDPAPMPEPHRCPLCYADKLNRQLYPESQPCANCPWLVHQGIRCHQYYLRKVLPPAEWAAHRFQVIRDEWLPAYRRALHN